MSKETIKIELNGKIICQKKFEKSEKLKLIREKIKDKIGKAFFVDKDNNLLELTDEEDFTLGEVLDKNILKLRDNNTNKPEKKSNVEIYLNGKNFCTISISEEDSLENLRNSLSNKIQDNNFFFLDEDGNKTDKEDENGFTVSEYLKDGKINISSNSISLPAPSPQPSPITPSSECKKSPNISPKINYDLSKYQKLPKSKFNNVEFYLYSNLKAQTNHDLVFQYFFDRYDPNDFKDAKIILFVGKTGDGKTTAINAFFNIIKGVQLEDNFRFILIKEPEKEKKQAESQTDGVHIYYLKDMNNKPVIILDSQGFGDTRGKKYDDKIIDAFTHIFTSVIDHINAVSFIVKATDCRLDIQIQYIINKVTGLFSEDICANFFVLATHANREAIEGAPNMIKTLETHNEFLEIKKKMQSKWYYALDSKSLMDNDLDKLAKFSFCQINDLYKEKVLISRPISVKKCSEVLISRNELRIQVNNLSTKFKNLLTEQNNLKEKEKSIEDVKKQINEIEKKINVEKQKFKSLKGKDLEKAMLELNEEINRKLYEIGNKKTKQKVKKLKEGSDEEYTHCQQCEENCHDPCDCIHLFTSRCTIYPVFGSDCEKCGHSKDRHTRDKFHYVYEYIDIQTIDTNEIDKAKKEKEQRENELRRNLNEENNKKTYIEQIIADLEKSINELNQKKESNIKQKSEIEKKVKETNNDILVIIVRLQSISQRLNDLAMNNNYIQKDNEYIDSLIDKYTEVYGNDNEKVKELEEMKKYNERFIKTVKLKKEELFNLNDSQLSDMLKNLDF